jgi:hypothetical protein
LVGLANYVLFEPHGSGLKFAVVGEDLIVTRCTKLQTQHNIARDPGYSHSRRPAKLTPMEP